MNGAESLARSLVASGIDTCFTNPGTSEMHFVSALDRVDGIRSILALFEGVVTGAADGYYRMADRPASTLLHLGPGLANGIANLHNARKAGSGIVNVVGEHASWHLQHNAPLTSDIEGLARPMSHWVRTSASADDVGSDAAAAAAAAKASPAQIATLILPGDTAWNEAVGGAAEPVRAQSRARVSAKAIEAAAKVLARGEPTMLLLGGRALRAGTLEVAGRIAARTGCTLATQFFSPRIERGAGRVPTFRIPYAVDAALQAMAPFRHIITVETGEPVAFFAYPGKPSLMKAEGTHMHGLCDVGADSLAALEALAEAVGGKRGDAKLQPRIEQTLPTGALTPESIAQALAVLIPENAVVVDESITTGREAMSLTAGARPHDMIQNMGGSIGYAGPVATGAAVAAPDRKVICLSGDGSAMYTIQSLWTQAREGLDVLTVVFANRAYQILRAEFAGVLAGTPGPKAKDMLTIDRPTLDFCALAKGQGVGATRVTDVDQFCSAFAAGCREKGPHLIEVVL
ncbi:MAG: acetolactate synthase large subunit [Hyphomicrobiaceae bacterium]